MEIVHKGAVEREVPWEPREEDVLEKPITSNLVELKEQESSRMFSLVDPGRAFSPFSLAKAKVGLSVLLEDRWECLWLQPLALQR